MNEEFIGIRQFSQKLFQYLKADHPIVLMKHGKPFRMISPVTKKAAHGMKLDDRLSKTLSHKAIGIWKKRFPVSIKASSIAEDLRQSQERRF